MSVILHFFKKKKTHLIIMLHWFGNILSAYTYSDAQITHIRDGTLGHSKSALIGDKTNFLRT